MAANVEFRSRIHALTDTLTMFKSSCCLMPVLLCILAVQGPLTHAQPTLADVPDRDRLRQADDKYLAVFDVEGDTLVGKHLRDKSAGELGLACWQRIARIIPTRFREDLVQFNIQSGRRWAGMFDGDGRNDVGRPGYRLSVARYTVAEQPNYSNPDRPPTPRRGTLDWTLVHELGHLICLQNNAIELFSQAFDGDTHPQPDRRDDPDDYPGDGSPRLDGDFVTSYAERNPGDEEAVETFTTYLLIDQLPNNDSLAARKIAFFASLADMPELRKHVQSIGDDDQRQED